MKSILVTSLFGAQARRPIVGLEIDGASAQFSPATARELARNLLAAAEAAEVDGFVWEWFTSQVQASEEQAVVLMADFRKYREAQMAREITTEDPE